MGEGVGADVVRVPDMRRDAALELVVEQHVVAPVLQPEEERILEAERAARAELLQRIHALEQERTEAAPEVIEVDDQDATFESHVDETVTEEQHQKAAVGAWGLMFHYDDEYDPLFFISWTDQQASRPGDRLQWV